MSCVTFKCPTWPFPVDLLGQSCYGTVLPSGITECDMATFCDWPWLWHVVMSAIQGMLNTNPCSLSDCGVLSPGIGLLSLAWRHGLSVDPSTHGVLPLRCASLLIISADVWLLIRLQVWLLICHVTAGDQLLSTHKHTHLTHHSSYKLHSSINTSKAHYQLYIKHPTMAMCLLF